MTIFIDLTCMIETFARNVKFLKQQIISYSTAGDIILREPIYYSNLEKIMCLD